MSYEGQSHHPHKPGSPPNAHLIGVAPSLGDRRDAGDSYVPQGLQLVQAHWFVRHGERSPVRQRLTGFGDIPAIFPLCAIGRSFSTAVLSLTTSDPTASSATSELNTGSNPTSSLHSGTHPDSLPWKSHTGQVLSKRLLGIRRHAEEMGPRNLANGGTPADCYWGELTDLGRESTLNLGARLRALYVDRLGFLPETLPDLPVDESPVYFRSTGMPRTIESLHQIVEGLFPSGYRAGLVDYTVRNPNDESLYPNSLCARMRQLDQISIAMAAKKYNPTLEPLDATLVKYTETPLRIDSSPRANGILDTLYVCLAHSIRTPSDLSDPKLLQTLESAVVHEWFDSYSTLEFTKLSMGRFLGDLKASLVSKIADPEEKKNKLRLGVYACHDTSLGGILNALQVFDGRWPPFTSHISVELFRDSDTSSTSSPSTSTSTSTSKPSLTSFLTSFLPTFLLSSPPPPLKRHYVRLFFNGRPLHLPACSSPSSHLPGSEGTICTFEAFSKAVERVELTGKEWEKGCKVKERVKIVEKVG
ncbi:BQ5605_C048g12354 [Microbotryum silenes-dioicae]|uniref:BQ5605_C048g12354 protein n=1 Tax=Microbotryum silenes-dioicae TaxID=796604 RepID=A0A2X0NAV6_9BASI|nr:BQ5605_C048g12354 [Microbotryum silenes-dioicae]